MTVLEVLTTQPSRSLTQEEVQEPRRHWHYGLPTATGGGGGTACDGEAGVHVSTHTHARVLGRRRLRPRVRRGVLQGLGQLCVYACVGIGGLLLLAVLPRPAQAQGSVCTAQANARHPWGSQP